MDQFCFKKIFTCHILTNSKQKNIFRSSSHPRPIENERKIFSDNDKNVSCDAQKGKNEHNPSLQNPIK
jgi:hypothetical protein